MQRRCACRTCSCSFHRSSSMREFLKRLRRVNAWRMPLLLSQAHWMCLGSRLMVTAFLVHSIHLLLHLLCHLQVSRHAITHHQVADMPNMCMLSQTLLSLPADRDPFSSFAAALSRPAVGAGHLVHASRTLHNHGCVTGPLCNSC